MRNIIIHQWVAHPLQSILVKLGFPKWGFYIHDITMPDFAGHLWSSPPLGHPTMNMLLKHFYLDKPPTIKSRQ